MGNIDATIRHSGWGLSIARGARDLSGSILVIGATYLSGGAALAVLGAGSGLQGWGKYQDTGKVDQAVLQGVGTFVVGAIPILPNLATETAASRSISWRAAAGGFDKIKQVTTGLSADVTRAVPLSTAGKVALGFIGAQANFAFTAATGFIQGQSAREALWSAAASAGLSGIGIPLADRLNKIAMPVAARIIMDYGVSQAGNIATGAMGKAAAPRAAFTPTPPKLNDRVAPLAGVPADLHVAMPAVEHVRRIAMRAL